MSDEREELVVPNPNEDGIHKWRLRISALFAQDLTRFIKLPHHNLASTSDSALARALAMTKTVFGTHHAILESRLTNILDEVIHECTSREIMRDMNSI